MYSKIKENLKNIYTNPFGKYNFKKVHLFSDQANWALDEEARQIEIILKRINIPTVRNVYPSPGSPQYVHYLSQFMLADESIYKTQDKVSIDYYHGMAHQAPEFEESISTLLKFKNTSPKIRVTNSKMEKYFLDLGISRDKVFKIPLSVDLDLFKFRDLAQRDDRRKALGISTNAFVVGSFLKDGVGWGEGLEPKFVKGPDTFLKVIKIIKDKIPELQVLLTGPSRGYVKKGLEEMKVPYKHFMADNYDELPQYVEAADMCLITSREEGGPKALLESMAVGLPVVITKVGQAIDIEGNGEIAFVCDIDDLEELSGSVLNVYENYNTLGKTLVIKARKYVENNSYETQDALWKKFFSN